MPRKGRGGSREGQPGTAYANRTDLNMRGPQPVTTVPGQAYGEATMQKQAQQAVPMAGVATPAAPKSAPAPAAKPPINPGEIPWLHESERPDENSGDPSRFQPLNPAIPPPQRPMERLADVLDQAAAHPNATQLVQTLAHLARVANV